jgi:hypothetical protein
MSPELRLMLSPRQTYASLARIPGTGTVWTALRRPLLVTTVIGASAAMSATGHVTLALVLSTTLCWSFVVALQAAIALALIAGPARRTVGLARAIDLYFAGHAPWSLWMLASVAWAPSPVGRPFTPVLVAAAVPLVLTPLMVSAFFREVLEMDPRHAAARTAVQQAMTWGMFVLLWGTAVALVPRMLEWLA